MSDTATLPKVNCDVLDWIPDNDAGGRWCCIHRTRLEPAMPCPDQPGRYGNEDQTAA